MPAGMAGISVAVVVFPAAGRARCRRLADVRPHLNSPSPPTRSWCSSTSPSPPSRFVSRCRRAPSSAAVGPRRGRRSDDHFGVAPLSDGPPCPPVSNARVPVHMPSVKALLASRRLTSPWSSLRRPFWSGAAPRWSPVSSHVQRVCPRARAHA
jgi:hypothetical protein